jgi:hypothetical protein
MRIPICLLGPPINEADLMSHPFIGFFAVEAIIQLIAMSFLQIGMEKERAELNQRRAAQTDELTGAANRRSILEQADALLARLPGSQTQRRGASPRSRPFQIDQ